MVERSADEPVTWVTEDRVATITIAHPPVNALADVVIRGLAERLDRADADADVDAIVLTGANRTFVAGADIVRLRAIAEGTAGAAAPDAPSLSALIDRLERGPKPVVAAIDGFALGGGLELAMGAAARIGTPGCRVGLPELALGLVPGAGGTQRLPRLAGLAAALELMLTSRPAKAEEALALGILDEIVDADTLLPRARQVARELASGARERRRSLELIERVPPPDEVRRTVDAARRDAARKTRYVTPIDECLDAVTRGLVEGAQAGLAREREAFLRLLGMPATSALIHVFFAERAVAKVPQVTDAGLRSRPRSPVAVVGGGTMGVGIATSLIRAGIDVRLREVDDIAVGKALARIRALVQRDVEKARITRDEAHDVLNRLVGQTSDAGFDEVGMVIEAATENVALKRGIFEGLVKSVREDCLLATNTSTIDLEVIGQGLGVADRLVGTHFFSPAHVMPLVEVVRTAETSAQSLVDVLAVVKAMRKTAVTVGNCTGFLVNRIFMPYGQVTGLLVDRGVHPYRIDRALVDFGMPMGPNRMGDLAGLDVSLHAGRILDEAYADRAYRSPVRAVLVEAGRLGEKAARGFYRYEGGAALEDADLDDLLATARERAGTPPALRVENDDIVRMTLFGVVNEACRALDEGVALRPGDVDVACILGYGFPRHRGGPMKWADTLGAKAVHDALVRWKDELGEPCFTPSERLVRKANSGASLLE